MDTPVALHEMTFNRRDEFHRESIAENIIKLLDADVDFCPMVIDGGWGTGKTEFCHKLINLIKEQDAARRAGTQPATDIPPAEAGQKVGSLSGDTPQPERAVIYLDAFASETVDDPLLCILAAIRAEFPEEETRKEISQRAVPVVKTLCKVAGKAAFAHIFKQDIAEISEELAEAASDGANALIDQTVDKLLDQYADAQKNIESLQGVLTIAAATRPIIFFIDELDRCRPDFALSILELVKHIFEIPGIKFVFVANMEQIKAVIRKRYGQDVDADVYLEKFVNLSIVLPPVNNLTQENAAYFLIKNNLSDTGLFSNRYNIYEKMILYFIDKYNISLRGIEKLIKNINIYMAITNKKPLSANYIYGYNVAFLLSMFIFTFKKGLANKIIVGNIDNELFNFVGTSQDERLNTILVLIANLIYYGDKFSIDKLDLPSDKKVDIDRIFMALFHSSFYPDAFSTKEHVINFMRTMNMLSING